MTKFARLDNKPFRFGKSPDRGVLILGFSLSMRQEYPHSDLKAISQSSSVRFFVR